MSESKQSFDNKGEENELSARISAVKNNIEEKVAAQSKERGKTVSEKPTQSESHKTYVPTETVSSEKKDKPDISFKKETSSTQKKPAAAKKTAGADNKNNTVQNKPTHARQSTLQNKSQGTASKKSVSNKKPVNQAQSKSSDVKRNPQKKTNGKAVPKTDKPVSNGKNTANRNVKKQSDATASKNTSKGELNGKTSDKINNKANNKTNNKTKGKPKARPASANAVGGQEKGNAKKQKFTKKQALTIGGLIVALFLILIVIVFLIFNHYYNLLDKEKSNISNSTPLTYSDVDYSRSDTMDKTEEDEKLKELMEGAEKISDDEVMNILLIGEDLRDTEGVTTGGNTDVMMIISVNTKDKTITLTSIMRDCYVYIPGQYSTRINAAYWLGGVDLTEETIETYMNVEIDRYVLVNFMTFIDIVDSLGGLDLYVSDEEANGYEGADPNGDNTRGMQNPLDEQNKYLGNKKGTDYLESGGNLHLNGNQALAYARLRHIGNSDYERTERQRKVIKEIIKKSRDLSLVEMDSLANEILPQIETDITKAEAAQLLIDMLDYRNYTLQEYRVPADGTYTNEIISGMDVLSVDFTANAEAFQELVYGSIEIKKDEEDEGTGWTE